MNIFIITERFKDNGKYVNEHNYVKKTIDYELMIINRNYIFGKQNFWLSYLYQKCGNEQLLLMMYQCFFELVESLIYYIKKNSLFYLLLSSLIFYHNNKKLFIKTQIWAEDQRDIKILVMTDFSNYIDNELSSIVM